MNKTEEPIKSIHALMYVKRCYLRCIILHVLLFVTFSVALSPCLFSQTYFFDNYSTPQGFESKVYAIEQDKHHYVWLGTQTGVTKFDGIIFTNYTVENGLSTGSVRVLYSSNSEKLWLGHEGGGISRYSGEKFERISILDTILRSNITSITQDKENQLWITTERDGALVIHNPDDQIQKLSYEHYLKGQSLGDQVFNCLVSSKGIIYFVTNAGIRTYNKATNTFEKYKPDGMDTYFLTTVMFEDSNGNLWFGTYNGGLSKLDTHKNKFEFYNTRDGLAANWISTITEDNKGNIWIGHWSDDFNAGGISCISPGKQIKVFNTKNGLHDNRIWCIKEDAEGNILIGTTEQGLDIFKGEKFISFSTNDGLLNNQVYAIMQRTSGDIWFGTNEGITVYSQGRDKSAFIHFNQSSSFISNQIRSLKADANENIWIGTADLGVMMYNTTTNRFVAQPVINSYLPYKTISKDIRALEVSKDGKLWIGTLDGLVEYDIQNNNYVATYTQGIGLAGNDISALYFDSKGDLWIGSRGKGLTKMHQGKFSIIQRTDNLTPTCITADNEGKIWVGTESKGVLFLENDTIKQFTTKEGLIANLVNLLICDKNNNIFVGTNRGLNIIDRHNDKILSYTRRTGFVGIETKNNATCIDNNGNLWFGTANGAILCNKDLLLEEIKEPLVQLTEIVIKGNKTKKVSGLKLASYENDITFQYISISMTNPEGISYEVMLKGLHDNWIDQKDASSIVFNKLQPGRYTFFVRAKNDHGVWSSIPVSYSFRILAPFYRRGYFIIGLVIIVLASIITYIRIRERNLKQEKKILEEKVNERTLELSVANEELSMKNKDILDSITYAKRIQLAILPSEIPFSNTFILFKPKDIVSGDFYWLNCSGGKEFLAAVDCTGHGVPGAFMSFIGYTSLNKIIIEQGIYKPSAILNLLNKEIATSLHQKGEDIVNDGMDIALICYTPETEMLEYAGAFNPLIYVHKGELNEIKADRFAIGRSTGREKTFTNHELKIHRGDLIYLYSDGYADQFGGPNEKKYKTSALRELLLNNSQLSCDKQREVLDREFETWKGHQQQIDDVLVIGRKF